MTRDADPSEPSRIRKRIVEKIESLDLLDLGVDGDTARARRLAQVLEQVPDRFVEDIDKKLSDALAPKLSAVEKLVAQHGISTAEQKLLLALTEGRSVGEHAEDLDISINTARTHMRRLLEKTGSQSQVDLVRKLL